MQSKTAIPSLLYSDISIGTVPTVKVDFMSLQVLKEPLKRPYYQEPLEVLIAGEWNTLGDMCIIIYRSSMYRNSSFGEHGSPLDTRRGTLDFD